MQINRAENRRQMAEDRRQRSEIRKFGAVGIGILMFGFLLTGCGSQQQKPYDKSTLITYAELTLLYEKEKMVNKQTDSSYVIKVNDFFARKGLHQDEFKKRIEAISQNDENWKVFIQDVSMAMDSLKRLQSEE